MQFSYAGIGVRVHARINATRNRGEKKMANECFSHRIEIDAVNMICQTEAKPKKKMVNHEPSPPSQTNAKKEERRHHTLFWLGWEEWRIDVNEGKSLFSTLPLAWVWSSIKINYNRAIFPLKVANEPLMNALNVPFHCKLFSYYFQQRLELDHMNAKYEKNIEWLQRYLALIGPSSMSCFCHETNLNAPISLYLFINPNRENMENQQIHWYECVCLRKMGSE